MTVGQYLKNQGVVPCCFLLKSSRTEWRVLFVDKSKNGFAVYFVPDSYFADRGQQRKRFRKPELPECDKRHQMQILLNQYAEQKGLKEMPPNARSSITEALEIWKCRMQ